MIRFFIPHRQEGEKIILLVRRHWFILLWRIILWTMVGVAPIIIFTTFSELNDVFFNGEGINPIFILFASVYYLYILLFLLNSFVDYYLDVWVVTNERILNIEQCQLFSRISAEQKLSRIQDVTAEMEGILPTFLKYGNVYIQTAGEKERFIFKQVPRPFEIAQKISGLAEYKRRYQRVKDELDQELY